MEYRPGSAPRICIKFELAPVSPCCNFHFSLCKFCSKNSWYPMDFVNKICKVQSEKWKLQHGEIGAWSPRKFEGKWSPFGSLSFQFFNHPLFSRHVHIHIGSGSRSPRGSWTTFSSPVRGNLWREKETGRRKGEEGRDCLKFSMVFLSSKNPPKM